jgi:ubiquinone/menaquinone biosynthesis C-methylase UbiE
MFQAFLDTCRPGANETLLDVGATGDRSYSHSNYLEAWYPHKHNITAVGIDDATHLEQIYPGLRFVLADGRDLPFPDNSFDHVHSSAVLEHVGGRDNQARFLSELWRVARLGLFVTTPNRLFPVEFHTVLPLVHWLPPRFFRLLLQHMGRDFFALEENLNLMTLGDIRHAASCAGINDAEFRSVNLLGWPSNLLLFARKARPAEIASH